MHNGPSVGTQTKGCRQSYSLQAEIDGKTPCLRSRMNPQESRTCTSRTCLRRGRRSHRLATCSRLVGLVSSFGTCFRLAKHSLVVVCRIQISLAHFFNDRPPKAFHVLELAMHLGGAKLAILDAHHAIGINHLVVDRIGFPGRVAVSDG